MNFLSLVKRGIPTIIKNPIKSGAFAISVCKSVNWEIFIGK